MPKGKTKRAAPSADNLQKAVDLVNKGYSQRKACEITNVSRATLQRRLKLPPDQVSAYPGFQNCRVNRAFTDEEEQRFIAHLRTHQSNPKRPLDRDRLRTLAYQFARDNKIAVHISWRKERKSGIVWCKSFMKRYQQEDFIQRKDVRSSRRVSKRVSSPN